MNIPLAVTGICPQTGMTITVKPERIYEDTSGVSIAVKCLMCDNKLRRRGDAEYDGQYPQIHIFKLDKE